MITLASHQVLARCGTGQNRHMCLPGAGAEAALPVVRDVRGTQVQPAALF